jgi:hypothetical protein
LSSLDIEDADDAETVVRVRVREHTASLDPGAQVTAPGR